MSNLGGGEKEYVELDVTIALHTTPLLLIGTAGFWKQSGRVVQISFAMLLLTPKPYSNTQSLLDAHFSTATDGARIAVWTSLLIIGVSCALSSLGLMDRRVRGRAARP